MSSKKKIAFIVNPRSGTSRKKNFTTILQKHLDYTKFDPVIYATTHAHHGKELTKKAIEEGCEQIIVVGGDGSVNDSAQMLINKEIPLGIIPSGSGNGLARHLHLPINHKKAIEIINNQKIISIDSVSINNIPFFSIAGIGFDALIAKSFSSSKKRGFFTYLRLGLHHYFKYNPITYNISIDGKTESHTALFICFANSNQFGYNTIIAPHASLIDDAVDVCIIRKIPFRYFGSSLWYLLRQTADKSPFVRQVKGKKIQLMNNESQLVNIDGESIFMERELQIEVIPLSLKVIIP